MSGETVFYKFGRRIVADASLARARDPLAEYFTDGWANALSTRILPSPGFVAILPIENPGDPYETLRYRFWSALGPTLRQIEDDARARWDHMAMLSSIDPAAFLRDDWAATPHGLIVTRLPERAAPTSMSDAMAWLRDDRRPYGSER